MTTDAPTPETPVAAPLTDAELDELRLRVASVDAVLAARPDLAAILDEVGGGEEVVWLRRMVATIDALRSRLDHLEDCKAELDAVVEVMGGSSGFDPEKPSLADDVRSLRTRLAEVEGLLDCRAGRLLRSGEPFFVVKASEPYAPVVVSHIKRHEGSRWTDDDERWAVGALGRSIPPLHAMAEWQMHESMRLAGERDEALQVAAETREHLTELRALYDEALAQLEAARREAAEAQASLSRLLGVAEWEGDEQGDRAVALKDRDLFDVLNEIGPAPGSAALDGLITEAVEAAILFAVSWCATSRPPIDEVDNDTVDACRRDYMASKGRLPLDGGGS